jgi:hypothetical protein
MDAELEGERALHHLETAAPAAVLDQLLLVAAAAAPPLLAACPAGSFPPATSQLERSAPCSAGMPDIVAMYQSALARVQSRRHAPPPDVRMCRASKQILRP